MPGKQHGEYANGPILSALPPPRPRMPQVPELGPLASRDELAAALGTAAIGYNQHLPVVYGELDEMRGAINHVGRLVLEVRDHVVPVEKRATLPGMRDPDKSYSEIVDRIGVKLEGELKKLASLTPGPEVNTGPEQIVHLATAAMRRELEEKDRTKRLAAYEKAEEEARQEDKKRARDRRKWWLTVSGLLFVALVSFVGSLAWLLIRREALLAEGEKRVKPQVVEVPVLAPTEATASPAPTAPAAVAPPTRKR